LISLLVGNFLAGRRCRAVIVVRLIGGSTGGSTGGFSVRDGGVSCGEFGCGAVVGGAMLVP
jgi:hypothetical protein